MGSETQPTLPILDMRPSQVAQTGLMTQLRHDIARLRQAAWAFSTRRVPQGVACTLLPAKGQPQNGDLVLARVDAIGHHAALQLVNGRRRQLFVGSEVVVAYGNRYASNQFESVVPESMGPCQLVAGGGMASRVRTWHEKIARGPTEITPIGLLGNSGRQKLNLRQFAREAVSPTRDFQPTTIAVVGTSMDSGKTQTCVHLVRGLIAAGLRVGYAKITGTGSGGDYWALHDAGANPVMDFTDVGWASTYLLSPEQVEAVLVSLIQHVAHQGVDAMVLEIADGVFQRETAALLRGNAFATLIGGIVLAAQDSMGAAAGVSAMQGLPPPVLALSGVLTAAPLMIGEAHGATGLPIYNRDELATGRIAMTLLGRAQQHLGRKSPSTGVA